MPSYSKRNPSGGCNSFHSTLLDQIHPLASVFFGEDVAEVASASASFQNKNKARLTEPEEGEDGDNYFIIQMEVPGVQTHQITIEECNGELEIMAVRLDQEGRVVKTYQDVLYLHPSKADFPNLVATLKDGILTIRIPKKQPKNLKIEVEAAPPPALQKKSEGDQDIEMDCTENDEFQISIDLPGVSCKNIDVNVQDDTLFVAAKRSTLRDQEIMMRRRFDVPPSTNMTSARASLQNGVFVLTAPRRQTEHSAGVRTFYATPYVEDDAAVMPSVATMNLDSDNDSSNDKDSPKNNNNIKDWDVIDSTNCAKKAESS